MPTRKKSQNKAGDFTPATLELLGAIALANMPVKGHFTPATLELLAKVKAAEGLTVQDMGGPIESLVEDIVGNSAQATAAALIQLSHLFQRAEVLCDSDEHTMACLWDAVRLYAFAHSPKGRELLRPHIEPPASERGDDGRT
jgi:hypothetical protein